MSTSSEFHRGCQLLLQKCQQVLVQSASESADRFNTVQEIISFLESHLVEMKASVPAQVMALLEVVSIWGIHSNLISPLSTSIFPRIASSFLFRRLNKAPSGVTSPSGVESIYASTNPFACKWTHESWIQLFLICSKLYTLIDDCGASSFQSIALRKLLPELCASFIQIAFVPISEEFSRRINTKLESMVRTQSFAVPAPVRIKFEFDNSPSHFRIRCQKHAFNLLQDCLDSTNVSDVFENLSFLMKPSPPSFSDSDAPFSINAIRRICQYFISRACARPLGIIELLHSLASACSAPPPVRDAQSSSSSASSDAELNHIQQQREQHERIARHVASVVVCSSPPTQPEVGPVVSSSLSASSSLDSDSPTSHHISETLEEYVHAIANQIVSLIRALPLPAQFSIFPDISPSDSSLSSLKSQFSQLPALALEHLFCSSAFFIECLLFRHPAFAQKFILDEILSNFFHPTVGTLQIPSNQSLINLLKISGSMIDHSHSVPSSHPLLFSRITSIIHELMHLFAIFEYGSHNLKADDLNPEHHRKISHVLKFYLQWWHSNAQFAGAADVSHFPNQSVLVAVWRRFLYSDYPVQPSSTSDNSCQPSTTAIIGVFVHVFLESTDLPQLPSMHHHRTSPLSPSSSSSSEGLSSSARMLIELFVSLLSDLVRILTHPNDSLSVDSICLKTSHLDRILRVLMQILSFHGKSYTARVYEAKSSLIGDSVVGHPALLSELLRQPSLLTLLSTLLVNIEQRKRQPSLTNSLAGGEFSDFMSACLPLTMMLLTLLIQLQPERACTFGNSSQGKSLIQTLESLGTSDGDDGCLDRDDSILHSANALALSFRSLAANLELLNSSASTRSNSSISSAAEFTVDSDCVSNLSNYLDDPSSPSSLSDSFSIPTLAEALRDAHDDLVPVRAHGLINLGRLLLGCSSINSDVVAPALPVSATSFNGDPEAIAHLGGILATLSKNLHDPEDFVSGAALKVLIDALPVWPKRVLVILMSKFTSAALVEDIRIKIAQAVIKIFPSLPGHVRPKCASSVITQLTPLLEPSSSDQTASSASSVAPGLGASSEMIDYTCKLITTVLRSNQDVFGADRVGISAPLAEKAPRRSKLAATASAASSASSSSISHDAHAESDGTDAKRVQIWYRLASACTVRIKRLTETASIGAGKISSPYSILINNSINSWRSPTTLISFFEMIRRVVTAVPRSRAAIHATLKGDLLTPLRESILSFLESSQCQDMDVRTVVQDLVQTNQFA